MYNVSITFILSGHFARSSIFALPLNLVLLLPNKMRTKIKTVALINIELSYEEMKNNRSSNARGR